MYMFYANDILFRDPTVDQQRIFVLLVVHSIAEEWRSIERLRIRIPCARARGQKFVHILRVRKVLMHMQLQLNCACCSIILRLRTLEWHQLQSTRDLYTSCLPGLRGH